MICCNVGCVNKNPKLAYLDRGWVVYDVLLYLHDTLQVTVTLGIVEMAQFRLSLSLLGVGPEHGSGTFTLRANDASHFDALNCKQGTKHREDSIRS